MITLTMARRLCLIAMVAVVMVGWANGQGSSYCSITREHTLCKHSGLGSTCGVQVPARGVSAQDAAVIVAQHNQLRSRVAMGQEALGAPGPQPQAANMRLMEWDPELAIVAQSHADQCIFEHECSDCRRVSRFGVGQNLFISFQSNFDARIQWGRAIKAWYDEVAEFSPSAIQPFQFSTPVGHYTQMMWWSSFKVGCGYTMFQEGGWWKKLYTCNYGPGGNIIFSQMYRVGAPCSACPAGTACSLQYPGLCEDENSGSSDTGVTQTATVASVTSSSSRPFLLNGDNNEAENEIPVVPLNNNNNNNNGFNGFNGFGSFNGINRINPNNVDLNALINFFNNRRNRNPGSRAKVSLITARPTTSTTTTTPPSTTATASTTTTSTTTQPPPPTTIRFSLPFTIPSTTTAMPITTPALTTSTTTTTAPTTTTSSLSTTASSSEGPAVGQTFPTNQVFQQRTVPTTAVATATSAVFRTNTFQQFNPVQQFNHEQEFEPQEPAEVEQQEFEFEPQEQEQEQEQEEFIPFAGPQPTANDLLPFLRRAGMNTQVIRTSSLANVQNIINSLAAGLRPIVLFRSGSGQLTELNTHSLLPIRRFGRSTTTKGPKMMPGILLTCDLDVSPCEITPVGGNWTIGNSNSEGNFTETLLEEGDGAQVVLQELVQAPATEAVCITFSHRRTLVPGASENGTIPDLMIGVMPLTGEVTRKSVGGASGMWEMSRISINNIKTPFLVVITAGPATHASTVALDAVQVTDGLCCMDGNC